MANNAGFSSSAGLVAITKSLSRTSGTLACAEVLQVIAAFCGLVVIALLLLATAALDMSIGSF